MKKRQIIFYLIIIVIFFMALPVLPVAVGFGKTGKNATVLGRDFSLLSKKDIVKKLEIQFPLPYDFILKFDNRNFSIPASSISASINHSATANNLLFRRLNQGIGSYIKAFFQPKDFQLVVNYNSSELDAEINNIASQIDRPFVPSELFINSKNQIEVNTGELGRKVIIPQLKRLFVSNFQDYLLQTISIPVETLGTLPTAEEIKVAVEKSAKLIGKTLTLTGHDTPIIIDDKTLVSWFDFNSSCRTEPINAYVDGLYESVKKDPVNAVFTFSDNKVLEFRSSAPGYQIDKQKLADSLCQELNNQTTTDSPATSLALPLIFSEPEISTANANNLGIKELIGKGTSTFKHSTDIRNFNVEKGASIVNRILIAPGETFSFVKALGEVTLDNGFKKAYVIRAGKTELDVGGGICQVSTTFFRALLNAGLNITERRNHAYRVGYYEEDMPPGYDATVFIPSPDLKFVNDTGNHILIQSTYDGKERRLTYEIYGTSDGRQVEITNYRRWDATPPPPAVYIDDPTLPPGKVIQDEKAIAGLKTAFDWKVTRNGEIIHQKTFTSNFVPWAAVYRRGPQN